MYAILYVALLEEMFVYVSHGDVLMWWRYIDDIFLIWTGDELRRGISMSSGMQLIPIFNLYLYFLKTHQLRIQLNQFGNFLLFLWRAKINDFKT